MPVVYQELITFGVSVVLPIQKNLRVSNSTLAPPSACKADMPCMIACMRRAVLRSLHRHVVRGLHADPSRHVDGDDRRIAGNVLAHVAGDEARAQVVVAARRGGDDHPDGLAAVEVGHRLLRDGG